ncbi:40S ribosomal protein S9 (nucleomorph) [Cryptomonas paramecium]|uniref:40S ribosomal protein S9 n=1 Tax=Cryptomonas paramaecium TaxID=2898 RepID=F2HHR6_9CRYP|nr:40S ribosomal protein S9 [Cryptomonas paramecium]AEA38862.1 40S ribosomal protein S9 [Cryptomonas paramecium]|mmetsp:Transcript_36629/g.96494  ORF Transcript_36629/g.96494 Transcript_36629/m.96494 type:complete len:186 (-) Transcript_36629:9087-9644(-)
MSKNYRNCSKVYRPPRRPYEKERIESELRLVGEYGLRNKREVWKVQLVLSKIRASTRSLLSLSEKDPTKILQSHCLLRKLKKLGLIEKYEYDLNRILTLKIEDFLERRLQTIVFKSHLAKSVHHARTIILQRHISIKDKVVTVPSYLVRVKSQKKISYFSQSPYSTGNPGRVRKKTLKKKSQNSE